MFAKFHIQMVYDSKDISKNLLYLVMTLQLSKLMEWLFMKYKKDLNLCFKDNTFKNYDFLGEVTLKSFRQVKDYMILNDLLPRHILIICLRMDFISDRTKRFHFQN